MENTGKKANKKVLTRKQVINVAFRAWYFSLPHNKIYEIKSKIIIACEFSDFKWNNILNGRSTPNKYEMEIINNIAGTNIFN
jgi:hypothetical protein